MIIAFSTTLNATTAPHKHSVHELMVCTKGSATLCMDEQRFEISNRHTLLIPEGILHHYELPAGGEPVTITFICFEGKILQDLMMVPALQSSFSRFLDRNVTWTAMDEATANETAELSKILLATLAGNGRFVAEKAETILKAILVNHCKGIDSPRSEVEHSRCDEIRQVLDWINQHLSEDIDIDTAARRAHMSRSVFTRYFRQHTNQTFSDYMSSIRLKYSADLLVRSHAAISDVAYQSGYRNLGHFYSQFQKRYGLTPSEYRKMTAEMTDLSA